MVIHPANWIGFSLLLCLSACQSNIMLSTTPPGLNCMSDRSLHKGNFHFHVLIGLFFLFFFKFMAIYFSACYYTLSFQQLLYSFWGEVGQTNLLISVWSLYICILLGIFISISFVKYMAMNLGVFSAFLSDRDVHSFSYIFCLIPM